MNSDPPPSPDESKFVEFRRKVKDGELLSAAVDKLLRQLHFTGRVSVIVQNGRVLKSGYEEGYFRRKVEPLCGREPERSAGKSPHSLP